MTSVHQAPPEHFGWLQQRTGCVLTSDFRALEARQGARILGMVGYCNWTPNSVEAHMAVDSAIAWRALLPHVFAYPFESRDAMLAVIPENNPRSLALTRRFGFRETHRVRDGWAPGCDLILFELRRAECRFLQKAS